MNIKERLRNGETLLGSFLAIPSPQLTEMLAYSNFDLAILDIEHGVFDKRDIEECLRAAAVSGIPTIARIPECSISVTQSVLDMGADGVQVAMIHSREMAEKVSDFCHFAPVGKRGVSPLTRAAKYCFKPIPELIVEADENVLVAIQIESKEGLENVDEILQVPGIDMIFVGVADLSVSLGMVSTDESMVEIVKDLGNKIRKAGKAAGIYLSDTDMKRAKDISDMGYNILTVTSTAAIRTGFIHQATYIKNQLDS